MFAKPLVLAVALAALWSSPGRADDVDRLYEALALDEVLGVMQREGLEYGDSIAEDMLQGQVSASWREGVERIYDLETMREQVKAEFRASLEGDDLAPMIDFFTTEPGETVIELEVSAREAMLDDDVEAAARETAALAMADETDRYRLIDRFAEVNDLVETNVASALNANLAFYEGLRAGGALPAALTDEQILAEVWSREAELRQSTTEWVISFLMMAYEPLSAADIEAYIAFSETEAGQALNRAIFAAFEDPFRDISRALGRLAGLEMTRQDI